MILLAVDCCLFIFGPANMTHKLSSACAETILSYHYSLQQNCFTHKLEPVTSLWRVCVVVCVLCGSLFCVLFGFVFGVFFVVCFLLFVFRFLLLKCDKGFGLCIGPLPVYFCGHYSFGLCTSQLINLICNMLGNMLKDLAEAIRRWTEKIKGSEFGHWKAKGGQDAFAFIQALAKLKSSAS